MIFQNGNDNGGNVFIDNIPLRRLFKPVPLTYLFLYRFILRHDVHLV